MVDKSAGGFWPSIYDPFRQVGARLAEWFSPASEASSNDDAYRIALEVPGIGEKDISLTVQDGVLTVSGEKKTEREESGETWYFSERQYGAFSRSFRLPADADEDAVEARLNDGVLSLTVPRKGDTRPDGARRVAISRG